MSNFILAAVSAYNAVIKILDHFLFSKQRRDNGDDSDEDYTPPQSQSYEDPNQRGRRHSARFGEASVSPVCPDQINLFKSLSH